MQSWRVLQTSPWKTPTSVFALARERPGTHSQAYTMDVRVNRIPCDLARVLGVTLSETMDVSEIVEGLILFEEEENAMIFMDLTPDADQVFCVDGPDAVKAMVDANGVVVIVDEPPVPAYLQEKLLSIAYDISLEKN